MFQVDKKGFVRSLIQEKVKFIQEDISITPETSTSTPDSEVAPSVPSNLPKNHPTPEKEDQSYDSSEVKMKRNHDYLEDTGEDTVDGRQDESSSSVERTKRPKDDGKAVTSGGRGDAKPPTRKGHEAGKSQSSKHSVFSSPVRKNK